MNGFLKNRPLIYLITDGKTTAADFSVKSAEILQLLKTAVESKVDLIQIREKQLPARLIFELAAQAAAITRNSETRLLVNDRADIALASKADGVHLTSYSLPAQVIRQSFPRKFIVGVSAHTLSEGEIARRQGADFVTFSPVFQTPSKENFGAPQGIENLRRICKKLKPFPVIALGGIDDTNYQSVLESGARGIAAIRFLNNTENLRKLAADLRR